jgi:hypothetical protein
LLLGRHLKADGRNLTAPRHLPKHAHTTCRTQLLYITRFITPTPHHAPITMHHPSPLRSAPQHIRDPFAAPVATSQTFPTFSQPSPAASLLARVRHRDDTTEDIPPPKRIRTDRGPRHSIEVRICHINRVHRVDPSIVVLAYTCPRTAFIQHRRDESSPSLCVPCATTFLTRPPSRTPRSIPIPLPFSNTQPKLVHIS